MGEDYALEGFGLQAPQCRVTKEVVFSPERDTLADLRFAADRAIGQAGFAPHEGDVWFSHLGSRTRVRSGDRVEAVLARWKNEYISDSWPSAG